MDCQGGSTNGLEGAIIPREKFLTESLPAPSVILDIFCDTYAYLSEQHQHLATERRGVGEVLIKQMAGQKALPLSNR